MYFLTLALLIPSAKDLLMKRLIASLFSGETLSESLSFCLFSSQRCSELWISSMFVKSDHLGINPG